MPKTFSTYARFDGGMNTEADPRDIAENEISEASNVAIDMIGRIRAIGALGSTPETEGSGSGIDGVSAKAQAGCGLYVFGADYDMSATPQQGDNKFIAVANAPSSGNQLVTIFGDHDAAGTTRSWVTEATLGTTPNARMMFYYANGALRICDANFGASNDMKWLGYINNKHFNYDVSSVTDSGLGLVTYAYGYGPTSPTQDAYLGWYEFDAAVIPPLTGIVSAGVSGGSDRVADSGTANWLYDASLSGQDYVGVDVYTYKIVAHQENKVVSITGQTGTGSLTTGTLTGTTWEGQGYVVFPPAGYGFTLFPETTGVTGTWQNTEIEFAMSYIYMDDSESYLVKVDGTFTPTASQGVRALVYATGVYDARIKGARVYYRDAESNDAWKLFADISMVDGARGSISSSYSGWIAMQEGDDYKVSLIVSSDPQTTTYESLTGFPQDTTSLALKAKCFAVGNGRAFAANVQVVNDAGDLVVYGDRWMYTPVGKYDSWPPDYYNDLVPQDGDQFTAMQIFADRLLLFKKNVMYIVNIARGSSQEWYRETQHEYMGVKLQGATCKTEFGVIWANENGCFIYDGQSITDLIAPKGVRRINKSDWETFITDYTVVGFHPKRNQVIVLGDASSSAGNIYICDLATGGWTKGNKFYKTTGYFTNFDVYNNDLVIGDYTT